MLKFNFKKLLACSSLLLAIVSCKKDASETQPNRLTSGTPPTLQALLPLPESRKTVLVVDGIADVNSNTFIQTIYRVNGLDAVPNKFPLFTAGKNEFIKDICRGPGVNNAFFLCQNLMDASAADGIWNVTMDGVATQVIKNFSAGAAYELDVDVIGKKLYWGEGPNANQMAIWKSNLDGSEKVQLTINGIPLVGRFAVDGEGKRIFFNYKKDNQIVIGTCDLNGNIITPVVTTLPKLFDAFSPIDLDVNSKKLYTATETKTIILFADMNGINQVPQVLCKSAFFNYGAWTFDFQKSNFYFSKWTDVAATQLFTSNFKGANEKVVIGGFSDIKLVSSIFTF